MKKNWISNIKTYLRQKNQFIIQDPDSFVQRFSLVISKRNTIVFGTVILLFFSFLIYLVIAYTSIKNFIPGYPSQGSKLYHMDKQNQVFVSNLEKENRNRDLWIKNLEEILNDTDSISLSGIKDTLKKDSTFDYKSIVFQRIQEDSILRDKVDKFNTTNRNSIVKSILISVLDYSPPHKGKIIAKKRKKLNEATFKSRYKEKVKASMDGVVVGSTKRSLIVQHSNNIVGVYSNFDNSSTSVGDEISKGKNLGQVRDSVFRFQLWYNGESVPVEAYEDIK